MCPHCLNATSGCIHCRDQRLENIRRERQGRRRLTDDQRREYGLIAGRLYTPARNGAAPTRPAPPTRNRDRQFGARKFGTSVLPVGFSL